MDPVSVIVRHTNLDDTIASVLAKFRIDRRRRRPYFIECRE